MKRTFLSVLVLSALLITACGSPQTPAPVSIPATDEIAADAVIAEGTLLPERSAELSFAQGGVVKEILVQPGGQVAEGEVIVRLVGLETAQAAVAAAKLEQTLAQQALDALHRNALLTSLQTEQALLDAQKAYEDEAGRWALGDEDEATDLEVCLDEYVTAEADYRVARARLEAVLYLDKTDHKREDAQEEVDEEKENLVAAYADLRTAVAENDKSLDEKATGLLGVISALETARELQTRLDASNLDPEIRVAAEARLEAASAQASAADASLAHYELRAPFNGQLLRLDLKVGETVLPMTPVAFMASTSHWIIETKDLAEVDVAKVRAGDSASVKLDAFPGESFAGQVTEIDPVGKLYLGDMTYQVTITLDEADARFMWNMTAVVTLKVADS